MPVRPLRSRPLVALLMVVGIFFMGISGVILFTAPPFRLARDVHWTLLSFGIDQWVDVHMTFGLLFVLASVFHIFFNFKSIVRYCHEASAQWLQRLPALQPELLIALLLALAVFFGAAYEISPFNFLAEAREAFEDLWRQALQ